MNVRVIPVVDLRGGQAVHARGGDRSAYKPVASVLCPGSRAIDLVRAYRDRLGLSDIYVADLDAIAGEQPDWRFYREAAAEGISLRVDSGLCECPGVERLLETGASLVVATETLKDLESLGRLHSSCESDRLIFGLDLRAGTPLWPQNANISLKAPDALLRVARDTGFARFQILDLAHVGSSVGLAFGEFVHKAVRELRGCEIVIGGGVRGPEDLLSAAEAGVNGVLVGSALHDGRLKLGDLPQRES